MSRALVGMLAVLLLAANTPTPTTDTPPPPAAGRSTAVVGGHHIQPRASTSDGAPARSREMDEVDKLYQQLMRETAPGGSGAEGPPPAQ